MLIQPGANLIAFSIFSFLKQEIKITKGNNVIAVSNCKEKVNTS